jgi:Ni/Co efflux regulator RcnB
MDRPARMDVQRQTPALDRPQHRAVETAREVQAPPPAAVEHRNFEPRMVRPPREGEGTPVQRNAAGSHVREWRGSGHQQVEGPTSTVERHAPGATIEERNLRRAPPVSEHGELVQQRRPIPGVLDGRERRISRTPILGTEPPAPRTAASHSARPERHWRTDWRSDHRYDWNNWRHHHRSHFHLGSYYDPFGWDYYRYDIGWRLWPSYYRSSYWLSDPWQYRLPPAYGPYRWVRYYDDAVLVNIYTGEVADIVYNFFW